MIELGLKNNILALILPQLLNVFNLFIVRNFMKTIPVALTEATKIDGADDFTIFIRVILPLSKPVLATIGLFIGLMYWNQWYHTMLYISDSRLYNLQ